jgi:putative Ca2+/H+ antiporter (TMEM165/GDT1 family)
VLGPKTLRWGVAASFAAMALWMLVPDRIDDDGTQATPRWGAFGTTVVAFFLAEMGDKTQIATVALAARFDSLLAVVAGSTCGILLADAPVVFLGGALVRKLSMRWVHRTCAAVFALLSVLTVLGADTWW